MKSEPFGMLAYNMKFNINISQKSLIELAPDINYEEAALLDFIVDMCYSDNELIEAQRISGYTWINYQYVFAQMPLLKGKTKGSLSGKLKKLEKFGFIDTKIICPEYKNNRRKYVKLLHPALVLYSPDDNEINMKVYRLMKQRWGLNETQARVIASHADFLAHCGGKLSWLKGRPEHAEDPKAYVWGMYQNFERSRLMSKYRIELSDKRADELNETEEFLGRSGEISE